MALTQPVPPGATGPVPSWDPTPPAPAGRLSQGLVLVTASLALWLATSLAGAGHVGVVAALVLTGAVALGLTTPAPRILGPLPGLVAALLALLALSFATSFVGGGSRAWGWFVLAVPLVLIGLDWQRVGRLQAVIAVSTFVVIPLAAASRPGTMVTTLGWLVLAAACMWSLEQDRRRGEDRPLPLVPGATDADAHPDDLLRTVLLAAAIGVIAALLVTVPSCNVRLPHLPGLGGSSGSGGSGQQQPGERDPNGQPGRTGSPGDGTGRPGDSQGGGSSDGRGSQTERKQPAPPRLSAWWLLLLVAIAAAIAWFWWRRSRSAPSLSPDRDWALALVDQIDRAGRARGRPRGDAATVRHHTDDLADSVLPDDRLRAVGRVLDGALFGRTPVNAGTRLWAQSVVDEIVEAHPPPGRKGR